MSAQETYVRLLETAMDLIWHSSYNAVGINDICKRAGVTKGGFYHHFESKANLFCEATRYYWESVRRELDSLLSPSNAPLEQLENIINFIYSQKFGASPDEVPGCPFLSASAQSECADATIHNALFEMSENSVKYCLALVRNLDAEDYLEGEVDAERLARMVNQYIQGAVSYARVTRDVEQVKQDLPEALYRLVGLKREYWFATQATWEVKPCCFKLKALANK